MVRVFYMVNDSNDILVSTCKEKGYRIIKSYTLNDEIDNTTVWTKIGQLMDEYNKHELDEEERLYLFSKIFKDYLIPNICIIY